MSRRDQFEKDRQNMLSSINEKSDANGVKANTPKANLSKMSQQDFKDSLNNYQTVAKSPEEFKMLAHNLRDEAVKFELSLLDKTDEEADAARMERHNKIARTKERVEQNGPVDVGRTFNLLSAFIAKGGGGTLMLWIYFMIAIPVWFYYYSREYNTQTFLAGIFAIAFLFVVVRCVTAWTAFFIYIIARQNLENDVRFMCEIRSGAPLRANILTLMNICIKIGFASPYIAFFGCIGYGIYGSFVDYRILGTWFTVYLVFYCLGYFLALMCWMLFDHLAYQIYQAIVRFMIVGEKNIQYRLCYMHHTTRPMFPVRNSNDGFPSQAEMITAFRRDYTGIF